MSNVRYVFAVMVVTAVPPAVVWWFVVHPFVGFWRRVGTAATLGLMTVFLLTSCVGLFLLRDALVGPDLGAHIWLVAAATVLVAGAIWIGLKRRRYLTTRILVGIPQLEKGGRGGHLLTEGPYAVMRHPRYVEFVLGALGYAMFANFVGAYVVALATIPALHAIVILEERELAKRFGEEYEAYRACVPRYVPRRMRTHDRSAAD